MARESLGARDRTNQRLQEREADADLEALLGRRDEGKAIAHAVLHRVVERLLVGRERTLVFVRVVNVLHHDAEYLIERRLSSSSSRKDANQPNEMDSWYICNIAVLEQGIPPRAVMMIIMQNDRLHGGVSVFVVDS